MFWLFQLVTTNPDDFWLNVVAGLPFLAADVLLLTLLLPWVIEKWTDRRWKETRRVALGRVMLTYVHVMELSGRQQTVALMALEALEDRSAKRADELAFALFKLSEAAREHVSRAEAALQTVMPILGPEQVRLLLTHHITWVNAVNEVADLADLLGRGHLTAEEVLRDLEANHIEGVGLQIDQERLAVRLGIAQPERVQPTVGPIWSPLTRDFIPQGWEVIVARVYGGVDLDKAARLERARRRQERVNDLRRTMGATELDGDPDLLDLTLSPVPGA